MSELEDRFVAHLESLRDDRGALAKLRRGLGKAPGEAVEMHAFVLPWLPDRIPRAREDAFYLVAALFACHPALGRKGSLGTSFRALASRRDSASIERRFVALLDAHEDDLSGHLRHAVSLLKADEVPVNWPQLLRDIQHWGHPDRWVQRRWARDFWGGTETVEPREETSAAEPLGMGD